MDKYEYKVRAEEIKELIARREYAQAAEIADTIDWRRVKSVKMLCTISDLYKINRRYEDSRDMLLLAYDHHPGGRTIVYALCELSIKMGELPQAVEYCKEFVQIAPKDPGRYILQYKIYEAQEVSLEERIEVLEELKKRDYREKWAYELAYLYHRVGLASKCVDECDEMIVWFGDGKYVIKAMELKMLHQPLTPEQQKKYDNRFAPEVEAEPEQQVQEQPREAVAAETAIWSMAHVTEALGVENVEQAATKRIPTEEIDIQVKTMEPGQCNTINLQEEVAAGLRELWEGRVQEEVPMAEAEVIPEEDTREMMSEVTQELHDAATEVMQKTEELVIEEALKQEETSRKIEEDVAEAAAEPVETVEEAQAEVAESIDKPVTEIATETVEEKQEATDDTAAKVMEQLRQGNAVEPPKEMAKVLSMEADGQISFVVPEKEAVEKQITGQISIADIMAEWERMKKELEEKGKEKVRQHVKENTGQMFTEFEASVRDGLLEQLEKGQNVESVIAQAEGRVVEEDDIPVPPSLLEPEVEELPEEVPVIVEETVWEEVVSPEAPQEVLTAEDEVEELTDIEEVTEDIVEEPVIEMVQESIEVAAEEPDREVAEEVAEDSTEETVEEESIVDVIEEVLEEDSPEEESGVAKVRNLTKEEKELFSPYIQGRASKEQLIHALDNISMAAYTGNLVITGSEGLDTLGLAKNIIRDVQMTDSNFSGKIAKISGDSLNKRDVNAVLEGLTNGALIIQKAADMNDKTVEILHRAMQQENTGMVVVLEGTKKAMNAFLERHPKLQACFTARIDMEALSDAALVAFGKKYAREKECSIDEMGVLALHEIVMDRQTNDHAVTLMEVKEIMDEAIESASRASIGHFFDIIMAKRYDEEDMIIIREKDFR